MPFLIVRELDRVVFSIPLRGVTHLGRDEGNDLVLLDTRVSRRHCRISLEDGRWVLSDLGSTHGTFVGAERVERRVLCDGDQILLGDAQLSFLEEEQAGEIIHQQATGDVSPHRKDAAGEPLAGGRRGSTAAPQRPSRCDARSDERLRILHEVSRAIDAASDADELLQRILDALLDVLGCEGAMIGLREPDGALRRLTRAETVRARSGVVLSREVLQATLERREALIMAGAPRGSGARGATGQGPCEAMCAPLALGGRVLGLVHVVARDPARRFTVEDLDFLVALAHLTAAALETAERCRRAVAIAEAMGAGAAGELLGESPGMRELRAQVQKFGSSRASVLIRGESGTGKELVARALHAASPRAAKPLVAVNCAAIPDSMIESELFGHERGAFTDAARSRRGKFTLAHEGTLFLDEIGDLSLAAQAKVLRAIQEREIQPLGSDRTIRVDVRLLAATHKDLTQEIAEGRFREDLYYRLNVVEIMVPPLRDRGDDIQLLAQALLRSAAVSTAKGVEGFTPAALAALGRYRWPGNVRELRNEVERAAIHAEGAWIDVADLSPRVRAGVPGASAAPRGSSGTFAERYRALKDAENLLLEEALRAAQGNLSEAARLLGISWIMMKRRAARLGSGPE